MTMAQLLVKLLVHKYSARENKVEPTQLAAMNITTLSSPWLLAYVVMRKKKKKKKKKKK